MLGYLTCVKSEKKEQALERVNRALIDTRKFFVIEKTITKCLWGLNMCYKYLYIYYFHINSDWYFQSSLIHTEFILSFTVGGLFYKYSDEGSAWIEIRSVTVTYQSNRYPQFFIWPGPGTHRGWLSLKGGGCRSALFLHFQMSFEKVPKLAGFINARFYGFKTLVHHQLFVW